MRFLLITTFPLVAALSQVACGGSPGAASPSTPEVTPIAGTTARFATTEVDFGTVNYGGSALRQVEVFNDGTAEADFAELENLGTDFTSRGCEKVAAGASCWLNITMRGIHVGTKSVTDVVPARADSFANRLTLVGRVRSTNLTPCGVPLEVQDGQAQPQMATVCP